MTDAPPLQNPDDSPLVHGYQLRASGGHEGVVLNETKWVQSDSDWLWLHFDRTRPETEEWLRGNCPIPEVAIKAMLAEETRPGILSFDGGHVINLRGVNLNENSEPEDMLAIRLWVDKTGIVSLTRLEMKSVSEMAVLISSAEKSISQSQFLVHLSQLLIMRIDDQLDILQDQLGMLEDVMFGDIETLHRAELVQLRRRLIPYKRFLVPQRNAISRLASIDGLLFSKHDRHVLLELDNQNTRIIEQLSAIDEKTSLLNEEFANQARDRANRTSYLLTLVAAIFLPLGFLTGLFGMNVGGMPGIESQNAFFIVSGAMFLIVILLLILLRWLKWV